MFGFIPALKTILRLALLSKPASRLILAPLISIPASVATLLRSFNPSDNKTISDLLTGAIVKGERMDPQLSEMAIIFSPFSCLSLL